MALFKSKIRAIKVPFTIILEVFMKSLILFAQILMFCLFSSVSYAADDNSSAEADAPIAIENSLETNAAATKIISLMRRRLARKVVAEVKTERITGVCRKLAEAKFANALALNPNFFEDARRYGTETLSQLGYSDMAVIFSQKSDEDIREETINCYTLSFELQALLELQEVSNARARAEGRRVKFPCSIM